MFIILFYLFFVCNIIHGNLELPSYIKKCSQSDPMLSNCLVKNGQDAIQSFVNGDPTISLPNLNPLKIDRVSLEASKTIKLFATDIKVYGLNLMQLNDMNWNFDDKRIVVKLFSPELRVEGTYNMDGRILIMTLKGSGLMNNTHYYNNITAIADYVLQNRNGENFLQIDKLKIDLKLKFAKISFANLLNNKELSKQMNSFLNDNWKILVDELIPSISEIISTTFISIMNPIAAKIPFNKFLDP